MFDKLKEPFDPKDIQWRAGSTSKDKTTALALAYIDARAVMDRLDLVCGEENWSDEYVWEGDAYICRLSILVGGKWVVKSDGAPKTNFEGEKGGISDAFKRTAVKWGIGRYLYGLEGKWVKCETRGNSVILKETPTLPEWALPEGYKKPQPTKKKSVSTPVEKAQKSEKKIKWDQTFVDEAMKSPQIENVFNAEGWLNLCKPTKIEMVIPMIEMYKKFKDEGKDRKEAAELTKSEFGIK
jgi:hypothetical protein